MINSLVYMDYLDFILAINTDCTTRKNYATYGDIIIQNTIITGERLVEQRQPLMLFNTNHNFTFDNNTIDTYSRVYDANQNHLILNPVDSCKVSSDDGRTKIQKFTNIRIQQHTAERNIQGLYYMQFMKGGDKPRQIKYIVENITIENVYTKFALLWIGTNLPDINLTNVYIRNTTYNLYGGSLVNITSTSRIIINSKKILI